MTHTGIINVKCVVLQHPYYFALDNDSSTDDSSDEPVATWRGRKRTKSKKRGSKLWKGLLITLWTLLRLQWSLSIVVIEMSGFYVQVTFINNLTWIWWSTTL